MCSFFASKREYQLVDQSYFPFYYNNSKRNEVIRLLLLLLPSIIVLSLQTIAQCNAGLFGEEKVESVITELTYSVLLQYLLQYLLIKVYFQNMTRQFKTIYSPEMGIKRMKERNRKCLTITDYE